jgi:hypothetical protein
MLELSAGLEDNIVPLPEPGDDIASLLKIISRSAGDVNEFPSDLQKSLRLLKLARKYDVTGANEVWISLLVERYIKSDPFECFAVACESTPTDADLAKKAIRHFPSDPVPRLFLGNRKFPSTGQEQELCGHLTICPEYARKIDPAFWTIEYVNRLGTLNFLQYVRAWRQAYVKPINVHAVLFPHATANDIAQDTLNQLATSFWYAIQNLG